MNFEKPKNPVILFVFCSCLFSAGWSDALFQYLILIVGRDSSRDSYYQNQRRSKPYFLKYNYSRLLKSLELALGGGIWQYITASHLGNKQKYYQFIWGPSCSLLRKEG